MSSEQLFTELDALERCTNTILEVFEGGSPDIVTVMETYDQRSVHLELIFDQTSKAEVLEKLSDEEKRKCSSRLLEVQKKEQKIIDIIAVLMRKTQEEQEKLEMHVTAKKRYRNQGSEQNALFITSKLEG